MKKKVKNKFPYMGKLPLLEKISTLTTFILLIIMLFYFYLINKNVSYYNNSFYLGIISIIFGPFDFLLNLYYYT